MPSFFAPLSYANIRWEPAVWEWERRPSWIRRHGSTACRVCEWSMPRLCRQFRAVTPMPRSSWLPRRCRISSGTERHTVDVLEQRTKRFTEGALLPVLLRLALPVVASITLQTLYQLVNAFW